MSLKMAIIAFLLPLPLLASEPEEKKSPPEKKEKVDLQVDWSKVPPEKILSLIKQFEDDPLKAKTDGIAGLLLDFGEKSEDVLVEVNLALTPTWPAKEKTTTFCSPPLSSATSAPKWSTKPNRKTTPWPA